MSGQNIQDVLGGGGSFRGPEQPDDPNATIWRYMDFPKFMSLLVHKTLVFSPPEGFEDPYEGAYTHAPHFYPESYKKHLTQAMIESHREQNELLRKLELKTFFINCWHLSEYESEAMWKLYSQSNRALCISSTFATLGDQLPAGSMFGKVKYLDYSKDVMAGQGIVRNEIAPFFHKRRAFEHEREVRAILYKDPMEGIERYTFEEALAKPQLMIISLPVDLEKLIRAVHIAPTAPSWFSDLVSKILEHYELDKPVLQSEMDTKPRHTIDKRLPD